ncbi:hypothetical protein JTB14_023717 [Gonioctena quinquepunctata]|nr:hypothetical protein JTB14_023717 [Gonioctena quinquepunctata]
MDNSEEIYDESDQETTDPPVGYYTRSKRRKLNNNTEECTVNYRDSFVRKRKNPIMFIPTEMLEAVFTHISYHELSQTVRLVNRRFKIIAENMLNRAYKKIEKTLDTLTRSTEISTAYTQDDMEIKCVTKLLNLLEILKMQYILVIGTIWRYVYNEYYRAPESSMYAGHLIDAYHLFVWKFSHNPNSLYSPAVIRDYALPTEVTRIIQMTKNFCVHFDKVSEEPQEACLVNSGCKVIDIVNCAKFIQKVVTVEKANEDCFEAQVETKYF